MTDRLTSHARAALTHALTFDDVLLVPEHSQVCRMRSISGHG